MDQDETPLMLCCRKGRARAISALLHVPGVGRRSEAIAQICDAVLRASTREKQARGHYEPVDKAEEARRKAAERKQDEAGAEDQ